ncbi:MAG TPA: HAD family phosphatase [Thermodesulfobacteriota bacterium]|nr:HAD family phosphatase [Thermodesulfobacteriota bacterium]
MIKAIIFDWGGVLIDHPIPEIKAYCARYLRVPERELGDAVEKFRDDFARGTISEDEFWEKVCSQVGAPKPDIGSLWEKAFRNSYSEKHEILSLASSLRENGYKIGFLSNTEIPGVKIFQEKNYNVFDVLVFSCLEGTIKPERRAYEIALERLGAKPEEAIFIDDRQTNIKGAKEIGINAILFKNIDHLKRKLASFSVQID